MKFPKVDKMTINLIVTSITLIIVIATASVSIPIKDSEVDSEVLLEETTEESLNYTLTESVLPKEYELILSKGGTEIVYYLTAIKISYDYENNSYTIETDRGNTVVIRDGFCVVNWRKDSVEIYSDFALVFREE